MTQVEEDKVMVLMDGKNFPPSLASTVPRYRPPDAAPLRNSELLQSLPVRIVRSLDNLLKPAYCS